MSLLEIVGEKVNIEKEEFIKNLPEIDCRACNSMPEGKFCCPGHYYRTRFDYKSSFYKNCVELSGEYFGITEDKIDEFKDFCEKLADLYY